MKYTIAFCFSALISAPLCAQTFEVDSTGYGTSKGFFEALSNDLIVIHNDSTIDRYESTDESPLAGQSSRCFGTITIIRGVPRGGGNCVFTDPQGDKVLQSWNVDTIGQGVAWGSWFLIGGTGAHEGVTGRGSYESRTDHTAGTTETRIKGTVTWPE